MLWEAEFVAAAAVKTRAADVPGMEAAAAAAAVVTIAAGLPAVKRDRQEWKWDRQTPCIDLNIALCVCWVMHCR